jgi:membrane dipeptidase
LIADAHNDLLLELVLAREEPNPFAARWLPKLRAGGVALQVCPIYTADDPAGAPAAAGRLLEAYERALDENDDAVFAVRSRADLERVGSDDRIGLLLSFEGVEALGDDPAAFERWWDAGVRMVGLTHNPANAFAGGVDTPATGLTDRGRALVDELVTRGVVIDLAHASDRTFADVLEHAPDARVVVTHACCRALHPHRRNVTDEQIRAIAARDGVIGMMALTLVVGPERTLDRLVDHVDHVVALVGGEHVAIGADVIDQAIQAELAAGHSLEPSTIEALEAGGGVLGLDGFTGPEHFPALVETLRRRGYDGERLDAITHRNLLRVLGRSLPG